MEEMMKDLEEKAVEAAEEVTAVAEEAAAPEVPAEPVPSMEEFADELEASFKRVKAGDMLKGKVIAVDETGVTLDLEYFAPGKVPADEMSADPKFSVLNDVAVGDEFTAEVTKTDDGSGNVLLSKKKADARNAWTTLNALHENKTPVHITVSDTNKAGAVAYVEGVRGFIPASRLGLSYVENIEEYKGKEMDVLVHEVDEKDRKLILSARELLRAKANEERKSRRNAVKVGEVREGKVDKIMPYGAFIDLGEGISGLLHVSQISDKRIKDPSVVLTEGQTVTVKVTKTENGKISLSMRALIEGASQSSDEEAGPREYKSGGEATTSLASLFAGLKLD